MLVDVVLVAPEKRQVGGTLLSKLFELARLRSLDATGATTVHVLLMNSLTSAIWFSRPRVVVPFGLMCQIY